MEILEPLFFQDPLSHRHQKRKGKSLSVIMGILRGRQTFFDHDERQQHGIQKREEPIYAVSIGHCGADVDRLCTD